MADETIIYTMIGVNKIYPPNKTVIKDISLSYFYGAKIGVLGLNGAGKSTLLRIMAGVEKDFNGDAHLSEGYSVGLLDQEPVLDSTKTVREIVEEGFGETIKLLRKAGTAAKIIVGGAVLTAEYAKEINADMYASDGVQAVRLAEQIVKK